MDTKRQEVEEKRDKLNNKIKNLYGPITGNRILHESAIRAIEKHHSKPVKDVLKDICTRKDAEELENWRGFYSKVNFLGSLQTFVPRKLFETHSIPIVFRSWIRWMKN